MEKQRKVGIGSVVMRNKQYLAALRPLDTALAMSTMRFADEVVPKSKVEAIPSRAAKPQPKEIKLAETIIESLSSDWEPKRYRDTYTDQLRDVIERKAKGEQVDVSEESEPKADVLDLMAALEKSVSDAKRGRRATKRRTTTSTKQRKPKSRARKSA
jgi:DNA end-binding protein Ku